MPLKAKERASKAYPCWCQHPASAHDFYHPARISKICKKCPNKFIYPYELPNRIKKYVSIKLENGRDLVNWRSHVYVPMDNFKYVEFKNDRAKRRAKSTRRKS